MPANFPTNPSVGDRHTIADKTWEYTGNVWDLVVSTNTLQFSGEDSTVISLNLTANEELRIVGDGTNISTTGSAGDSANSTLQISLSKDIDVNTISSTDSTSVTINDGLIVTGNLSFDGGSAVSTILDEDDLSSDSDTALATQQSIKAYVDTELSSLSSTLSVVGDDSATFDMTVGTDVLQFSGGNNISTSTSSSKIVTVSLDDNISLNTIGVNTIQSDDSTNIRVADNLVPATDDTYTLGTPDRKWQALYVTGSTIFLDETKLQIDGQGDFTVKDANNDLKRVIVSELEIGSGANKIKIKKDPGTGKVRFTDENDVDTPILHVYSEDSTGTDLFSGETIKFVGDPNISITVNEDSTIGESVTNIRLNDSISLAGNLDVSGNAIIDGNLTVQGTTTYIETTNTKISDPLLLLNNGNSGGSDIDAGIMIERGSAGNNAVFYWNEGEDVFKAITTTSGENASAITDTQLANVRVAEPSNASDAATKNYVDAQLTGGGALVGTNIALGSPTDSSTYPVGAISTLTTSHSITDSIDDLNEALENVRNNTFVKSVDFTANTTSGGAGTAVTLTISVTGNANRYDITWGDGDTTVGTSDSTPTHTYSTNAGSPFDVTVRAYNSGGQGTGSEAEETKSNYITIYTATPVVTFDLYRSASGGSALSGNDLYVIEGNSLYMDNNSTNIGAATVDYTMAWGDGSSNDDIANDSAAGGTQGARLQHTWADGTTSSTSRDTLTLTLNNHSTALPADIPASGTVTLKVYDDGIAAPNGLSSKTLPAVSSVGISPKLASGFTDNTGGATVSAGDTVNRVTSGTAEAGPITTFAYNASSGTLTANVNGAGDGNTTLTAGDDSGTYTSLVITSESDYNLLNATGASTTFAASIYHPDLYKGFKAKVSKSVSALSTGVNSYQLSHSATGSTNTVEFVKDNLTATPTVNVGSATVSEGTQGTYRYISGVPYYNSGSPTLTLAGVTIDDLVGQCYTNQSNIVEVDDGTNQEGTASNAIANTDYTYANIDGAQTMLSGGIPTVNVGTASAYAIGNLTVPITSSSVRTVSRIKVRARNVNGVSSYSSDIATNIAVHTAAQSGINETAVVVSDSLGAGYDDDAVRIFDFSAATTDTPSYNNATNFYTNSTYSESSDPGVAGTQEATVRLGVIKYDVTDYSTGYLPVGPDRSSDTGTQYFTMAFRRTTMSNFTITLTGTVSGVFIAAPGTAIDDASSLNGWLDASVTYGGSGVPGANTGSGGNGSNGCAFTSGDRIIDGTSYSNQSFTLTLGTENGTNATGNVVLVRLKLNSGDSISAVSIS